MTGATEPVQREELDAAAELWEVIAAYSWDQYVTFGVGLVLTQREALLNGSRAKRLGDEPTVVLGFVPLTDIPPGDDYRGLLRTIDPRRQVALLVGRHEDVDRSDAEQLYVLEMLEGKRPSPEQCYFARRNAPKE